MGEWGGAEVLGGIGGVYFMKNSNKKTLKRSNSG